MCRPVGVINQCIADWNVSPYMCTCIRTYVGMYSYAYFAWRECYECGLNPIYSVNIHISMLE